MDSQTAAYLAGLATGGVIAILVSIPTRKGVDKSPVVGNPVTDEVEAKKARMRANSEKDVCKILDVFSHCLLSGEVMRLHRIGAFPACEWICVIGAGQQVSHAKTPSLAVIAWFDDWHMCGEYKGLNRPPESENHSGPSGVPISERFKQFHPGEDVPEAYRDLSDSKESEAG